MVVVVVVVVVMMMMMMMMMMMPPPPLLLLLLPLLLVLLCFLMSEAISPWYFSCTNSDPDHLGFKFQNAVLFILCVMFQVNYYDCPI